MNGLRTLGLMTLIWLSAGSFAFAYTPVISIDIDSESIAYSEGDGNLTLSIENGSTGILTIKHIMVIPDTNGRSAYILFADNTEFPEFVEAVAESEGPVIADLDGTQISARLYANASGTRLYGRIIESGERVYVVPSYLCRRFRCPR